MPSPLTPEQAREIAKDYAPDIVADVEEHVDLTGVESVATREHVEEELTHMLERLAWRDGERS